MILIRLADQSSLDLAADRLGQFIHVFDHTRILVGRSQLLDMLLQLLGQFFRRCIALGKHDRRLDDLSADRIRDTCDGTLNDCVVSNQGRLDLERSDTVAGALDDVVISSDKAVIARTVAPEDVAGIVADAAQLLFRHHRILVVACEKAYRRMMLYIHHSEGAFFTVLTDLSVRIEQLNVEQRVRLSCGALDRLEPLAAEIGNEDRAFCLTESLIDLVAGQLFPALNDFRVERFACCRAVVQRGEVEL